MVQADVRAGRLDGDAVNAVLAAAGQRAPARREWPAGLTAREVEVLGLVARGHTNREVAQVLVMSPKTVSNHVEHIYHKIDVTSRAGATLFATRHGLTGSYESADEPSTLTDLATRRPSTSAAQDGVNASSLAWPVAPTVATSYRQPDARSRR